MLEKLTDLPSGTVGLRAVGRVTKEDYETSVEPLLAEARRDNRRIRFLYQLGPEFEGVTPSAAWEDAKLGLRSMRLFEGCAVVTDVDWIRESTKVAGYLMPCPVRAFPNRERGAAIDWLAALPGANGLSHHLQSDKGVIVVKITGPLRAQDFDALGMTADAWIEEHGSLQGIVLHTRAFPGWENLGSLIRHVQFVRDHHTKVRRVALVTDGAFADVAPRITQHFVKAELKAFPYDQLEVATAWAATRTPGN
jgi:hypothetical protein